MSGFEAVRRAALFAGRLIIIMVLPAAAPVAGQGHLVEGLLDAALEQDPAQAEIRLRYRLRPGPADTVVPIAALPLSGVQLIEVIAGVDDGDPVPLVLAAGSGGAGTRLEGSVRLPARPDGAPVTLDISYRVIGPTAQPPFPRRVEIPVVAVLWPPSEAVPGTFRGAVSVHPGLTLSDAFPADLMRAGENHRDTGGRVHTFDLPVTPSLLAFTLSTGSAGPGADTFLDVAALAAVLLFGWIGWRRFRAEM